MNEFSVRHLRRNHDIRILTPKASGIELPLFFLRQRAAARLTIAGVNLSIVRKRAKFDVKDVWLENARFLVGPATRAVGIGAKAVAVGVVLPFILISDVSASIRRAANRRANHPKL